MVPCKCCSSDKLDFTTKEINSILRDGVINVSLRYREGYWDPIDQLTLEEAIEKVPQDYRSPLRIIQFLNKEGYNEMWTWRGLDVEKEWGDINFWVKSTDDNTIIDEVHLKDGAVTTEKIADGAVTFRKLAEDAKGVIIPYGTSADIVKEHLKTYKGQTGRLGLYVADSALGNVPAINSEGNIIRAVSIVKSTRRNEYVDVFILVFDGYMWSRQTYSQVGRVPGNNTVTTSNIVNEAVTTSKIADKSVTTEKIADKAVQASKINDGAVSTAKLADSSVTTDKIKEGSVTTSRIADAAVTTPKIADGAVTNDKIGDGAVGNDNIADGAVTNDKICPEAITIDKLELDLEAMVSDNVKYRKQNLTIEQKAQARKNIDVDYLTEDEVANLWDTTK